MPGQADVPQEMFIQLLVMLLKRRSAVKSRKGERARDQSAAMLWVVMSGPPIIWFCDAAGSLHQDA
jgi:hypothetical protein